MASFLDKALSYVTKNPVTTPNKDLQKALFPSTDKKKQTVNPQQYNPLYPSSTVVPGTMTPIPKSTSSNNQFSVSPTPQVKAVSTPTTPPPVVPAIPQPQIGEITDKETFVNRDTGGESAEELSTPELDPSTKEAIQTAENLYQQSLKISPEELSTQEQIDKLIEATKKGYLTHKGQPIAMGFITGQLKAIEERALNMAEPLEDKLARLQAQRESAIETSKFGPNRS